MSISSCAKFSAVNSLNNYSEIFVRLDSLLPFFPKNQFDLAVGFKNYYFLLDSLEKAFIALKERNFEAFDALVGENACQVRALWIYLNSIKCLQRINLLLEKIKIAKEILRDLRSAKPNHRDKKTFQNVFDENPKLILEITQEENFLLQAYILTIFKISEEPDPNLPLKRNDKIKLRDLNYGISTKHCNKIVDLFRKNLSFQSVLFMREQAVQVVQDHEKQKILCEMVSEKFTVITDTPRRTTIPYFWSFQIFVHSLLYYKIPIVVRCWARFPKKAYSVEGGEKEIFTFYRSYDGKSFRKFQPVDYDFNSLAVVVEGVAFREQEKFSDWNSWKKEHRNHNIMDYLLTYAANHRQYVNQQEDSRVENADSKEIYFHFRNKKIRCSLDNPYDFFINHLYCSTIGHMIEKSQEKSFVVAYLEFFKLASPGH